ncbi:molecular chaperone TorD [Oceanibaculum pacificum]|uniref:Molecular chaperone TorD n=1 Tax=Oceanibaculum pacificum TaxID=580166 RepID=A0A154VRQ1_9PROT|nr:molecular chaperone TorD [Oceanibaculum pacificum]
MPPMAYSRTIESRIVSEEDILRAHYYGFVARFLASPPDKELLDIAARMTGDDTPLGTAIGILAKLVAQTTVEAAREEYTALFIGLNRGELMPYGSYYLTGFLHEKPLAHLRADMATLGIARSQDVKEPEDHIAALCEMMAGLIAGSFGEPADLATQKQFFDRHILSWAGRFFADLERAQAATLYQPIGTIGRLLLDIEQTAFAMEE